LFLLNRLYKVRDIIANGTSPDAVSFYAVKAAASLSYSLLIAQAQADLLKVCDPHLWGLVAWLLMVKNSSYRFPA
jgi:hypothetical protein